MIESVTIKPTDEDSKIKPLDIRVENLEHWMEKFLSQTRAAINSMSLLIKTLQLQVGVLERQVARLEDKAGIMAVPRVSHRKK